MANKSLNTRVTDAQDAANEASEQVGLTSSAIGELKKAIARAKKAADKIAETVSEALDDLTEAIEAAEGLLDEESFDEKLLDEAVDKIDTAASVLEEISELDLDS
jgi:DNA repair ATPase RecN